MSSGQEQTSAELANTAGSWKCHLSRHRFRMVDSRSDAGVLRRRAHVSTSRVSVANQPHTPRDSPTTDYQRSESSHSPHAGLHHWRRHDVKRQGQSRQRSEGMPPEKLRAMPRPTPQARKDAMTSSVRQPHRDVMAEILWRHWREKNRRVTTRGKET